MNMRTGFSRTWKDWMVTEKGTLHPEIKRYYVRIQPPAPGEPWYQPDLGPGIVRLNNRAPWETCEFPAEGIVDGGFLELVRYGVRRPTIQSSWTR